MDWTTLAFIAAVIVVGAGGFYVMRPEKKQEAHVHFHGAPIALGRSAARVSMTLRLLGVVDVWGGKARAPTTLRARASGTHRAYSCRSNARRCLSFHHSRSPGEHTGSVHVSRGRVEWNQGRGGKRGRGHAGSHTHDCLRADHIRSAVRRLSCQPARGLRVANTRFDDISDLVYGRLWDRVAYRSADYGMADRTFRSR